MPETPSITEYGSLTDSARKEFVDRNKHFSKLESRDEKFAAEYKAQIDISAGIGLVDTNGKLVWSFGPGRHSDLVDDYEDNEEDYVRLQILRIPSQSKEDRILIGSSSTDERIPKLVRFLFLSGLSYSDRLTITHYTDIKKGLGGRIFDGKLGEYLE